MAIDSGTSTKRRATPARRDVSSHLNKAEAATLARLDAKTRGRKTEKGYIVGADGKIIAESVKAGKRSAAFHQSDLSKAKDSIITHNHPNAELSGTMAGRIGLPLSPTDIRQAIKYDAKEIRAVTPNYTFSIRRPAGGWPKIPDDAYRKYESDFRQQNHSYSNDKSFKYKGRKDEDLFGRLGEAVDRGNVGIQSSMLRDFANKHGLVYSRAKTS